MIALNYRRCYCKLGEWQEGIHGLNDTSIPQVIHYYSEATKYDKTWYKAWHSFAYLNYEAVLFYKQQKSEAALITSPGEIGAKADDTKDEVSFIESVMVIDSIACHCFISLTNVSSLEKKTQI